MLVGGHVHAFSFELDAFGLKPQALFESGVKTQLDLAADAQDAMPGQGIAGVPKQLRDQTVVERIARGGGDLRVGRHLAPWNGTDRPANGLVPLLGRAHAVAENPPLQLMRGFRCGSLLHRRNDSVRPPSTEKTCPVVLEDRSLIRNQAASAWSSGVIGDFVSVRCA